MKTIEERAIQASEGYDDQAYSSGLYMGYKEGATEQREIDIDKAWQCIEKTFFPSNYPRINMWKEEFRKAMEE